MLRSFEILETFYLASAVNRAIEVLEIAAISLWTRQPMRPKTTIKKNFLFSGAVRGCRTGSKRRRGKKDKNVRSGGGRALAPESGLRFGLGGERRQGSRVIEIDIVTEGEEDVGKAALRRGSQRTTEGIRVVASMFLKVSSDANVIEHTTSI